jgi:hypothetical protein
MCRTSRFGRLIKLDVDITFAAAVTGGGTGYLQITGAPYTKAASTNPTGSVLLSGVDFTTAGASLALSFISSSATSTLFIRETVDAGAGNDMPIAGVGANDIVRGSIWYETDDP